MHKNCDILSLLCVYRSSAMIMPPSNWSFLNVTHTRPPFTSPGFDGDHLLTHEDHTGRCDQAFLLDDVLNPDNDAWYIHLGGADYS